MEAKRKILIIEDDPDWLSRLRKLMEKEGYEARMASNFDKAASLLQKHQFDAIVSDIRLKDWVEDNTQGLDVLDTVPADARPAVIVITAHPKPEYIRRAFKNYKVVDFIDKKSYTDPAMLKLVKEATRTTRARNAARLT